MAKMLASDYANTDAAKKAEAAAKAYRDRLNGTPKPQPAQTTQPTPTATAPGNTTTGLPGSNFNVNDYLSQYKDSISKPVTPFEYDMKSIKKDPLYTSALSSFSKDTERGTNQSLVNLGRRGIGNSQSAVTAELAGQQSINDYANTKLAPSVIAQKYQDYLYTNEQQDKKNQNILGFAKTVNDLGQQGFNNDLLTNQDNRSQQAQDANFTGYYDQNAKVKQQMQANSEAWFTASPEEQQRLHDENLQLSKSIGGTFDQGTGEYTLPQAQRTIAGQTADLNKLQTTSALTGTLPDGTPTYQSVQDAIRNGMSQQQIDNQASQFAESMGYNYDDMNANDRQAWAQIAISQSNSAWARDPNNPDNQYKIQQIASVKAELEQIGKTKPITTQDAINVLNKSPFVSEESTTDQFGNVKKTGKTQVDKQGMVQAIAGLDVPDDQMDALFNYYGISQAELKSIEEQLRKK